MKLRRTQVTIETHRVVVVRRRRVVRFWCSECGGDAEFVPVDDLNGLLEEGAGGGGQTLGSELHFGKTRDGAVVVCMKSLSGGREF